MALLPLADEEARRLLAAIPEEQRGQCWWLVLPDGAPTRGDDGGGVLLLAALRLTRPLGRALGAFRLSPVIDALDKLIARYRKRLGRFVPDGPAPRRYRDGLGTTRSSFVIGETVDTTASGLVVNGRRDPAPWKAASGHSAKHTARKRAVAPVPRAR